MAATKRAGARWESHERPSPLGSLGLVVATLIILGVTYAAWGRDMFVVAASFCGLPVGMFLALAAYSMGRGSGWEGLWTVRVFRDSDDVARRVMAALANAGRAPHRAPDRKPSRWLRIAGPPKGAPIELPNGTLVWTLMEARKGPAEPPATQIVLQPPPKLDPVELEFLKATVLAAMQPGYDAKDA